MPATRGLHRLRSLLWRYRPLLLALLTGVVVLAVLQALRPAGPSGVSVVVAARDLPAGRVLTDGDLDLLLLPESTLPTGTITSTEQVLGARLAHPMAARQALLPLHLADSGWGLAEGRVAVGVRLADPLLAAQLRVGDEVHLLGTVAGAEGVSLLTANAVVLAVENPASGGLLGSGGGDNPLLVLDVPDQVGTLVIDASARATLTAAWG